MALPAVNRPMGTLAAMVTSMSAPALMANRIGNARINGIRLVVRIAGQVCDKGEKLLAFDNGNHFLAAVVNRLFIAFNDRVMRQDIRRVGFKAAADYSLFVPGRHFRSAFPVFLQFFGIDASRLGQIKHSRADEIADALPAFPESRCSAWPPAPPHPPAQSRQTPPLPGQCRQTTPTAKRRTAKRSLVRRFSRFDPIVSCPIIRLPRLPASQSHHTLRAAPPPIRPLVHART